MFNALRVSCGVVILNLRRELLLCHVTGQDHWDLPKGGIDPGETRVQAAVRETREETGLTLRAPELMDLGEHAYTARKTLHLFAVLMQHLDPATLHCDSHFVDPRSRRRLPEMDGYGWFAWARVPALCTPKMAAVLGRQLDLAQVLARLAPAPAAGPG